MTLTATCAGLTCWSLEITADTAGDRLLSFDQIVQAHRYHSPIANNSLNKTPLTLRPYGPYSQHILCWLQGPFNSPQAVR